MFYLHLDNGDYNMKTDSIKGLLSDIDFELRVGAKKLMVTTEPCEKHPFGLSVGKE